MAGSCLRKSGLDQPAALLHVTRGLHRSTQRAEELTPQHRHRQQDQRPARIERMGGFRGRAGAAATSNHHHIGAEHVDHVAGLAHASEHGQIQVRWRVMSSVQP